MSDKLTPDASTTILLPASDLPELARSDSPAPDPLVAPILATLTAAHVRPDLHEGIVRRALGGELLLDVLANLADLAGTDIYTQEARS